MRIPLIIDLWLFLFKGRGLVARSLSREGGRGQIPQGVVPTYHKSHLIGSIVENPQLEGEKSEEEASNPKRISKKGRKTEQKIQEDESKREKSLGA